MIRIGRWALACLVATVCLIGAISSSSANPRTPGLINGLAAAPAANQAAGDRGANTSNIIKVQDGRRFRRQGRAGRNPRIARGRVYRQQRNAQRRRNFNRNYNRRRAQRRRVDRRRNYNRRNVRRNPRVAGRRAYRRDRRLRNRRYGARRYRMRNPRAWRNRNRVWNRYPRPPRWGRPGGRPWRYWRGHRYYWYNGGWWPYAWLSSVVVIPSAAYYYADDPAPPAYGPAPWTPEWYAYCEAKYKTFNPDTGYYFYKPGRQRFCR